MEETFAWEVCEPNRSNGPPKNSLNVFLTNSIMILRITSIWLAILVLGGTPKVKNQIAGYITRFLAPEKTEPAMETDEEEEPD